MFSSADDTEKTRKDLMWMLEALTQRNQNYLSERPDTPRLYKSGVVYSVPMQFNGDCEEVRALKEALGPRATQVSNILDRIQDVFGGERFRDIGRIIENGSGDCDNIACWRTAELRQYGIEARPYMTSRKRPDGGTTYHALVLWPPIPGCNYVTSEDPSLLLGMGQPGRAEERAEEIQKNRERCDLLRGTSTGSNLEDELAAILGIRKNPDPSIDALAAELERILRPA